MSLHAFKSVDPVASNQKIDLGLKLHLVNHMEKGYPAVIGTLEELREVVKIIENARISNSIRMGSHYYPDLPKGQYLVACVDNWLEVRVWGIYSSDQIRAMEDNRKSPQVNNIDWKILEISEELEAKLRKNIIDLNEAHPPKQINQSGWCVIL